jgi:hypothetical protein
MHLKVLFKLKNPKTLSPGQIYIKIKIKPKNPKKPKKPTKPTGLKNPGFFQPCNQEL